MTDPYLIPGSTAVRCSKAAGIRVPSHSTSEPVQNIYNHYWHGSVMSKTHESERRGISQ
jgi:hypothetical protein